MDLIAAHVPASSGETVATYDASDLTCASLTFLVDAVCIANYELRVLPK